MDFMSSKTVVNLERAFAGECQAQNRYKFYAEKAREGGLVYLARVLEEIAQNEYAHSQVFFNHISKHAGTPVDNITIDAGYPVKIGETAENMSFAASGEHEEHTVIYPAFAEEAAREGYPEIAASFKLIAQVETEHEKIFNMLHEKLTSEALYKSQGMTTWKCSFCGHTHTGTEAWDVCPLCGHSKGYVEIGINS